MRLIVDGDKLDYWMEKRGIRSDSELVRRADVGANVVASLRRGNGFESRTLEKIARALECNPLDLQTVEAAPELFSQAQAALS